MLFKKKNSNGVEKIPGVLFVSDHLDLDIQRLK